MRCGKLALCRVCRTGVDLVEDSNVRLQHRQLQDLIPFFLAACGLGRCLCSCTAAADQPRLLCKRRHSHSQSCSRISGPEYPRAGSSEVQECAGAFAGTRRVVQ